MIQYVVDANVAIKWILPEIYSQAALRLRNPNYQLLVPDFFFPERNWQHFLEARQTPRNDDSRSNKRFKYDTGNSFKN
ncbi:MAG: type II toxin-antitoxin system VapC family toxin [Halothece sp. Uz-M2-17]|nr:type II toxin-antitoxin system VapC family toxin [Halothece sp. Uz-M2-17]